MRKLLFLILTVIIISPFTVHAETRLSTAWPNNVGPLNPHGYNPNEMFAQNMVYEGLTHFDGQKIVPCLAESWKISKDGKTYTFAIRKNVKFSDGTLFTAMVAEKNFDAIMNNKQRHSWMPLVKLIQSWKALDEYTFQFTLSAPYSLVLTELSLPSPFRFLGINGFKDPNNPDTAKEIAKPIGTGSWQLTEQKLGQYDIFERNPHYREKTQGNIQSIKIHVLPDANSRILALETGQVDILFGEGNFNIENFSRLSQSTPFKGEKSEPRISCIVALNSNRSFTRDANVRKAILHAVNKDVIIRYILKNQEYPADHLFNPKTKFSDIGTVYAYSPEQAITLLETSGFTRTGQYFEKNGKTLQLTLHYLGIDPKQKAIAEAIQADLAQIGIQLQLQAEENTIFTGLYQNGEFDLIFNRTWGPPYEPTSYLASMRAPSHADYQAQAGLPNKNVIDKNITDLLNSLDEKERSSLHHAVLKALHDSAVYLPISYEPDFVLYNKNKISNFHFGSMTTEIMLHDLILKN